MADDVAGAEMDGVDVGQVQDHVVAGYRPVAGLFVDFQAADRGGFAARHGEELVADL